MQTFLPYPDFIATAKCLDYRRLGKQRVEARQIYLALTQENYGWKNHPMVKFWKGYEDALLLYGLIICGEWKTRGYKDTMYEQFFKYLVENFSFSKKHWQPIKYPLLIGNEKFHDTHKSNLLRKNKEYYSQFNWNVPDNLNYIWSIDS